MTVLRLQSVVVGKGFTQYDVIEHLDHPDATLVSFMSQERKNLLVLFECLLVHLKCKRIVLQLHQRGKGMSVPEIQRVHLVLYHHVQILHPLLLVVEPREVLWRIRILIDGMTWQINRLLQSNTCATHHHAWHFRSQLNALQSLLTDALGQFHTTIDDACSIVARHHDTLFILRDAVALCRPTFRIDQRNPHALFRGHIVA